ncbi:hypothetical protein scyTo_0010092 [Scyliorhinus torazame]|uniref:Uncharacterized protein n=1 Tax=Scyliorhinus torazame TaxID=75743 RepID=A0A401NZP4_SCYTO|nr:hypothetical protein [Scyliorhinus torazame]
MLEVTRKIKRACRQLYIYTVSINCEKIAYSVEINRLLWPVAEGTLDRHITQAQAKESQQQIPLNVVKLWASAFGGEIKSISAKYSGSQFLQKVNDQDSDLKVLVSKYTQDVAVGIQANEQFAKDHPKPVVVWTDVVHTYAKELSG